MLRLGTMLALVVVSAGVAVAQSSGGGGTSGSTGGTSSGATGATSGASPTSRSGATTSPTPGGSSTVPGVSTPSLSDDATVGRAPGVNPSNPQDASRRGNSSDRSLPGARNPQDLKRDGTGTPVIIAPERR